MEVHLEIFYIIITIRDTNFQERLSISGSSSVFRFLILGFLLLAFHLGYLETARNIITPKRPRASLSSTTHTTADMHASILLLSALGASVFAAPAYPVLNKDAVTPGGVDSVSEYFNMLATKVQQSRNMAAIPICDLSKAAMPVGMSTSQAIMTAGSTKV
jgi:hypothetical protein